MFFITLFYKVFFFPVRVLFILIERLLKKPIILEKSNIVSFFFFIFIFIIRFPFFFFYFLRIFVISYYYECFWEMLLIRFFIEKNRDKFLIYLQKNLQNFYFLSPRSIFIFIYFVACFFFSFCFIYAAFTSKVIELHSLDEPLNDNFVDSSKHQIINLFLRDFFVELLEMDYEFLNDKINIYYLNRHYPRYTSLNAVDLIQKLALSLHIYEEIDFETQNLVFDVLCQYQKEFLIYVITHSFFYFFLLLNIVLCIWLYFELFLPFLDYVLKKFYNPMISLYVSGYFNNYDQYHKSKKLGRFIGYYIFIFIFFIFFFLLFFSLLFFFNNITFNHYNQHHYYYVVSSNFYSWHFWPFIEKIEVLENKKLYEVDKVLIDNNPSTIFNIFKGVITTPQLSFNTIKSLEIINDEPCVFVDFFDFHIIKGNPLFSKIYQHYGNAYNLLLNSKLDTYHSLPYNYDFIGHKDSFLHLDYQSKIFKEGESIPISFYLREISPGVFLEYNLDVQFFKEEVPNSFWIANSDFNTEYILNEFIYKNPNKAYIFKTLDLQADLFKFFYFDKMLYNVTNMNIRSISDIFLDVENNKKNLKNDSCENNMNNSNSIIKSTSNDNDNSVDSINAFKCVCSEVSDTISEKIKEEQDNCDDCCCLCPFCFFGFPNYISVMFFCMYYVPIIELIVNPNMFFYHFGYGVAFSFYYPLYKIFIPYIFAPLKYYFYHVITKYIWAGTFITINISVRVFISAVGNTGEYTGGYVFILDP